MTARGAKARNLAVRERDGTSDDGSHPLPNPGVPRSNRGGGSSKIKQLASTHASRCIRSGAKSVHGVSTALDTPAGSLVLQGRTAYLADAAAGVFGCPTRRSASASPRSRRRCDPTGSNYVLTPAGSLKMACWSHAAIPRFDLLVRRNCPSDARGLLRRFRRRWAAVRRWSRRPGFGELRRYERRRLSGCVPSGLYLRELLR